MFRTQFDERPRYRSNIGSRFAPTYTLKYDKDGSSDLVETGKIDCYGIIQSYKDSCDLKTILDRYKNGDPSALLPLATSQPMFGDFTDAPTSLAEHLQRLEDARAAFDRLPVATRAKFNHDPNQFFASIGSAEFAEKMGYKIDSTSISPDLSPLAAAAAPVSNVDREVTE